MTTRRTCSADTCEITFIDTPCRSSRLKYPVNVVQSGVTAAPVPLSRRPSRGATLVDSPSTSSVTPCRTLLCAVPSSISGRSECV